MILRKNAKQLAFDERHGFQSRAGAWITSNAHIRDAALNAAHHIFHAMDFERQLNVPARPREPLDDLRHDRIAELMRRQDPQLSQTLPDGLIE